MKEQLDFKLQYGVNVAYVNQVISYERIVYFGYISECSRSLQKKTRFKSEQKKPHVAFGKRQTISETPGKIR
jgi:hypothetical protein